MTRATGIISGVSVSHERATVGEIAAACAETQRDGVEALLAHEGVEEAFVLQTCNRAEAYVVTEGGDAGTPALREYVSDLPGSVVRELGHEESLRHLMRVAAGLESLVLGEDEILGQVRTAYEDAREAGGVGPTLDDALLKALHVGERARTETGVNEGVVSMGSAAARLATEKRDLAGATALVVGAGDMGSVAARALSGAAERVLVANRTTERAEHVVEAIDGDGRALGLDGLARAAEAADVVVTATGASEPVLDRETLAGAGETLVVDIARPPDVSPGARALPTVEVYGQQTLESVTAATRERRQEAAAEVEAMIDREFDHLLTQYKRKRADEVIAAMYEGAERMKQRELRTALAKLDGEDELTEDQRGVVEAMADSLVSQLLAAPTESLREAAENDDWSTINTALSLFDPTAAPPTADFEDASPEDIPEEVRQQIPAAVLEQLDSD